MLIKRTLDDLTIQDDYMFKKVMENEAICTKMLERILHIKIGKITYREAEKSLDMKLESKGITSVKSRVVNLREICSDITAENMIDALKDSFESEYGELQEYIEYSRENFIPAMTGRYSDHDWIYGESPSYDAEIEVAADYGNFRMLAQVEDGIIKKAKIYTDSLLNFNHDEIEAEISGTCFHEANDTLNRIIEKNQSVSINL